MRSFPDDSLASRCKLLYLRHFREIWRSKHLKSHRIWEFTGRVRLIVKGNHCGNFTLFVIFWYLGNLKFLWGYSIIWFQRKFYLCYFIIKISMDSRSFFLFPSFFWHLWRAILFFTCQDLQVVMATRFINLGVYISRRLLFQVKTLAKVKHNYLLRGRHLLLRELVTNFFASWSSFERKVISEFIRNSVLLRSHKRF